MAKPSKKSTPKEKKSRGRQSDFSGEKEAYLDGLAKKFANCKDRSAFYGEAAQGLIDQFGYSRDGRVYVDGNTLSTEEKLEYYKNLRSKLGQWFRHRCLAKTSDRTYVSEIINSIKTAASSQPRKRTAISLYMEKNKEKLTKEFDIQWSAVQNEVSQKTRLPKYYEFAQGCLKKESESYRVELEAETQADHEKAVEDWKGKIETFNGTPEEFKRSDIVPFFWKKVIAQPDLPQRAWGLAETVLPSFADGFAEWLGAQIIIVAVSPNPSNGEITMQSVQSDCTKGSVKTLLPEFDVDGWKKVQETVINYGNAYFSQEERKRRIVVKTDEDQEAEITVEDGPALVEKPTPEVVQIIGDGKEDTNGVVNPTLVSTPIDGEHEGEITAPMEEADCVPEVTADKACDEITPTSHAQPPSQQHPTTPNTGIIGSVPPFPGASQTSGNQFGMHPIPVPGPPRYDFPNDHANLLHEPSSLIPYSPDYTSNTWNGYQEPSVIPSNHPSAPAEAWYGNPNLNPSGLSLTQGTKSFPEGSFLGDLYGPLDPSLEPSNLFHVPGEIPILGIASQPSHPVNLPIALPDGTSVSNQLPKPLSNSISHQHLLQPVGQESGFSPTSTSSPISTTPVQVGETKSDESSTVKSIIQGKKRKGEELVGRAPKRAGLKESENAAMTEGLVEISRLVKEQGEGTSKGTDAKERAGKATLSGRVPLMPTRLAEAGYQAEKKGIRGRGKKGQDSKNKGSKGRASKPASRGAAKVPGRKKVK